MATSPDVLILCQDLLFSSQLHGAVQRAGRQGRTCLSLSGCLKQLAENSVAVVIIDLETPDLDLPVLRDAIGPKCRLIGYAPHVREDLLQSAQAAGCDVVLTRGQAARNMEQFLHNE